MKIIIVDDDLKFVENIENAVMEYFSSKKEMVEVEKYSSGRQAFCTLENTRYEDIYLFDIEMPEISGMELAQEILEWNEDATIVFLTSHEQYAYPSIKLGVPYFIRKDEYKELIPIVLDRILRKKNKERFEQYYIIETDTTLNKIAYCDILYIQKDGKNTVFYCQGNKKYEQRMTLEKVYEQLPKKMFVTVARGFIVNMKYVKEVNQNTQCVELINGIKLDVSRRCMATVREKFMEYVGTKL